MRTASADIGAALGRDALDTLRRYSFVSQKRFEQGLTRSPRYSYDYAVSTLKGRFPAGERRIAESPLTALYYAQAVLHTKWPEPHRKEAEKAIHRLPESKRRQYAALPEPEPVAAKTSSTALPILRHYVLLKTLHRYDFLTKRVVAACATNALVASTYMALFTPKGTRWPEAESAIAQNAQRALGYARAAIGGRWPEAEPTIAQSAASSYDYALSVLEGPFPAGEPAIARDPEYGYLYAFRVLDMDRDAAKDWGKNYLAGRIATGRTSSGQLPPHAFSVIVEALHRYGFLSTRIRSVVAADPELAYWYAKDVLKARFPAGEAAISTNSVWAYGYAINILHGPWPETERVIATNKRLWADYRARFGQR